ncbi:hypothetical protein Misp03_65700 [Microbispora sp. NBRC 16548]|nr:hypothetical protein Misp03_65700 [Microbispora sp. NBRC 16548]
MRALDHAKGLAQRALRAVAVVDEDRQHLEVDSAVPQLGQPPFPEELRPPGRRAFGDRHQQVVVCVRDDRAVVEALVGMLMEFD